MRRRFNTLTLPEHVNEHKLEALQTIIHLQMKKIRKIKSICIVFAALLSLPQWITAENWTNWRGPHENGFSSEKGLPTKLSEQWKIPMPGSAAATPVIHGNHLFISTTDEVTQKLVAMCINASTGKVLWEKVVADGLSQDNRSNYASNSPVTDGERVIFFYGTGDLVAFDFGGNELWKRNIQKDHGAFSFLWTFSTSPALYGGKLYMQVLQRDSPVRGKGKDGAKSYILAINPVTGKDIWQHFRPSTANSESLEAFSTPVFHKVNGKTQMLIVGGDVITGHDPETGAEIWRWGTWNPRRIGHWRLVPSAVAGNGVALASAPKGEPIFAVKLGKKGTLDDSAIAWDTDKVRALTSDVPTPAFAYNDFFVLSDVRNYMSRVDSSNGNVKWSVELPRGKKWRTSPTVADNKIYIMNHGGLLLVLDATSGKILNEQNFATPSDDGIRSSIAIANGKFYIRTNSHLICAGS